MRMEHTGRGEGWFQELNLFVKESNCPEAVGPTKTEFDT